MKTKPAATDPRCAKCGVPPTGRNCVTATGRGPDFCPTLRLPQATRSARRRLRDPGTREFARQATVQEAQCCAGRDRKPFVSRPVKPRLQEIVEFAAKDRVLGHNPLAALYTLGSYSEWLLCPGMGQEGPRA